VRLTKNNLLPWFTDDHGTLPASYLKSCREFFKAGREDAEMYKRQAASIKPQASIQKNLHKPGTRVKNRFNRKI
jgi:hypothetical protein